MCVYIYVYIYIYIYQPLHHEQAVIQGQFFKQSLTGLNSEFSFSYTGYLNMVYFYILKKISTSSSQRYNGLKQAEKPE